MKQDKTKLILAFEEDSKLAHITVAPALICPYRTGRRRRA